MIDDWWLMICDWWLMIDDCWWMIDSKIDSGGSKIDPGGSKIDPGGSKIDPGGSQNHPRGLQNRPRMPLNVPNVARERPGNVTSGFQMSQRLPKVPKRLPEGVPKSPKICILSDFLENPWKSWFFLFFEENVKKISIFTISHRKIKKKHLFKTSKNTRRDHNCKAQSWQTASCRFSSIELPCRF